MVLAVLSVDRFLSLGDRKPNVASGSVLGASASVSFTDHLDRIPGTLLFVLENAGVMIAPPTCSSQSLNLMLYIRFAL